MTKTIIAFVGMPGAGKSEAVSYLEQQGFARVYFGGTVLEEVKKQGLEVNFENEKQVREEIRQKHGMAAMAILNLENIKKAGDKVVIDGIYSWDEYKVLAGEFGDDLIAVAITAPRKFRYQRLANRPERPLTKEQVQARDYAEIENIAKGGPIAIADYTIVNDDSLEDLHKSIDNILKKLDE